MKKTVDVAIVLLIVILFGGCLRQNPDRLPRGLSDFQNERLAYKSFDTLIEAINDKDKEKMKSVMSEHMLNEGKNIEAGIDYIFELIEDDVVSYEKKMLPGSESRIGKNCEITLGGTITVLTSTGENYYISFGMYSRNDDNPGYIGINDISAWHTQGEISIFDHDGIYVPDDYLKAWKEKQAVGEGTEMETGETESTPENVSETDAQDESSLR